MCYFLPVGAWLSLVERTVRDREVAGSNPVAPTIFLSCHLKYLSLPLHNSFEFKIKKARGSNKLGPFCLTLFFVSQVNLSKQEASNA